MTTPQTPRIRVYHNGLWAKYKGAIFSKIYSNSERCGVATAFVQTSETSAERVGLSGVDLSYHQYPFELLFKGQSDAISTYQLAVALVMNVLRHRSELVVIPGYHRVEYWAMLAICILLRRKRAVFVDSTAYESNQKNRYKEAAKAFFFRRCDGFFCYGIRSKEYVASYGVDEKRIYFGCQAAALPHAYDSDAVRGYYAKNPETDPVAPRFFYFGRLSAEKGLCDLLEAFSRVREKIPAAKLDIVGSGSLERELRDRATELGIDAAVAFLGPKTLEAVGVHLMESTAVILPSHREPWGLVVNESLSYGCPVVVSNICGCVPELVLDGITGYSYLSGDVAALFDRMLAAAELSKDRLLVANQCIDLIKQYTPENAALEILRGCVRIAKTPQ